MRYDNAQQITDEDRRDLLKALGIVGTVAAGGLTLEEIHQATATSAAVETEELALIGETVHAELAGSVDASLLASQQDALASSTGALASSLDQGFPADAPREEFAAVAAAGRPVYDHLDDIGFFTSTTQAIPEFDPSFLETAVQGFVASDALTSALESIDFGGTAGVDLITTVVANAEELSHHHWVATDKIDRSQIEFGDAIPAMTKGASGGVLLWLEDLDGHLWRQANILTEEIHADAVWHAQSMAAGFYLIAEGAKALAGDENGYGDDELGALLSTGFAVQAIAQGLLPQDVYWVTDEMRSETDVELETITR